MSKNRKVPKRTRKQKGKFALSVPCLVFILLIFALIGFRYPLAKMVKEQMAAMDEKWNPVAKPTQVVQSKPKVVKKKVVVIKETQEIALVEDYVEPVKRQEELLTGELKHYSFNSVVTDNCFKCHGAEGNEIEGEFNFKKFLASGSTNSKTWNRVYRSIAKGEMPPEEEQPLNEDEKELLLSSIKLMTADVKESATTRVLTPYEIQNTMADLFTIDIKEYNPFHGLHKTYSEKSFYSHQKNILSPYFIESYYHIIYNVLESFIGLRPQVDKMELAVNFPGSSHRSKNFKTFYDLRWPIKNNACEVHFTNIGKKKYDRQDRKIGDDTSQEIKDMLAKQSLPPGTYKLKFKASALNLDLQKVTRYKYGEPLEALMKSEVKKLEETEYGIPVKFYIIPPGRADAFATTKYLQTIQVEEGDNEYEIEFTLNRRAGIGYELGTSFPGDGQISWMIARHKFGEKAEQKNMEAMRSKFVSSLVYDFPMVRFKDLQIDGPYNVQLNPLSFDEDTKVTTTEVGQKFRKLHELLGLKNNIIYSYIFKDFQVDKMKYEDAYRNAMLLFFMSPSFLEIDKAKSDREAFPRFASYALHKSSPSKEFLTEFSKAKKTKDSKVFANWLIKHENFRRYIHSFAYQWLKMGEIKNALPEVELFGIYHAKNFEAAYRLELELFISYLFLENRPVHELVSANYSFWNEDLEGFYTGSDTRARLRANHPVKEIFESDFKQHYVQDTRRGGLLGMGAFLTATGNGVDPLPIKRANWILDNLLDSKLPPPPNDIDVEEFEANTAVSLKERLEVHSQSRACNSCHKRIDPLAIVMDCYDTIGGENPRYTADSVRINNQTIRGVDDLKVYLSFYESTIARSFCKKMISFILGRELVIKDEAKLDAIIDENRASGFRTADLYRSIIKHYFL